MLHGEDAIYSRAERNEGGGGRKVWKESIWKYQHTRIFVPGYLASHQRVSTSEPVLATGCLSWCCISAAEEGLVVFWYIIIDGDVPKRTKLKWLCCPDWEWPSSPPSGCALGTRDVLYNTEIEYRRCFEHSTCVLLWAVQHSSIRRTTAVFVPSLCTRVVFSSSL